MGTNDEKKDEREPDEHAAERRGRGLTPDQLRPVRTNPASYRPGEL